MPEFSSKTKLARLYVLVLSLKQVGTRKAGERRMDREKKAARKSELFSQLEESDTFWCPDGLWAELPQMLKPNPKLL